MGVTAGFAAFWRWSARPPSNDPRFSRVTAQANPTNPKGVADVAACSTAYPEGQPGCDATAATRDPDQRRSERDGCGWAAAGAMGSGASRGVWAAVAAPGKLVLDWGVIAKPRAPIAPFWGEPGRVASPGFTGLRGNPPAAKNCDATCPCTTVGVRRVTPRMPWADAVEAAQTSTKPIPTIQWRFMALGLRAMSRIARRLCAEETCSCQHPTESKPGRPATPAGPFDGAGSRQQSADGFEHRFDRHPGHRRHAFA